MVDEHSPAAEEVMAYVDGEVAPDRARAIEAHIDGCERCRAIAEDIRLLSRRSMAWQVESTPAGLVAPALPPRPRSFGWAGLPVWRPAVLVSASIAVVVVVYAAALRTRTPLRTRQVVTAEQLATRPGMPIAPAPNATIETHDTRPAPMIIRTATLRVLARDIDAARTAIDAIVRDAGGMIQELAIIGTAGTTRALRGTIRVAANRLEEALSRLRGIGDVTEDTQHSEDVTEQVVDLDRRLANARTTEQRMTEILRDRTGKLSDVLAVEQELGRVRLEIERMQAERGNLDKRVSYATITLQVTEERKAALESGPLSLGSRFRTAAADGVQTAVDSVTGMALLVVRIAPAAAVWVPTFWAVAVLIRRARRPTPKASE